MPRHARKVDVNDEGFATKTAAIQLHVMKNRRAAVVLALASLVTGCDGAAYRQNSRMNHFEANEGDFNLIAVASFKLIDPKNSIRTIIVPAGLDKRAGAALKKVAKVVSCEIKPPPQDGTLPAGVFVLHEFSIEDGAATIEGQLGPVTREITAAGLPDCGKNYTVAFYIQGGDWVSPSHKIQTCDQSRHWIPVDEDGPSGHQ